MYRYREFIEGLVAKGGPTEDDRPCFDAFVRGLTEARAAGDLSSDLLTEVRSWFGESLSEKTLQGVARIKPQGRACDFSMLDDIYGGQVSPDPSFQNWDHLWHRNPTVGAIRRRKDFLHRMLSASLPRRPALSVLKVGCGPGRGMYEWLSDHPESGATFHCIEADSRAVEFASRLNGDYAGRIGFQEESALLYRPAREYDLVWVPGLLDELSDSLAVRLIRRLFPAVAPGGELVMGNLGNGNPDRHYLELICDWRHHHRSRKNLAALVLNAGLHHAKLEITSAPEDAHHFLRLVR